MPEASDIVVRDLRPADEAAAVRIFADAFDGFPVLQVMTGSGDGGRERLERLFAMEFESDSKLSAVVAELDGAVSGAFTYADSPDCSATSTTRTVRFLRIAGTRVFRTMRMFSRIDRVHPKSRHRHLPTIGVDPVLQGRGIGQRLMQEFHRRCDEDGIAGYLETIRWADPARPSLEDFYAGLGHEIADVLPMSDDWAVVTMLRPPTPPTPPTPRPLRPTGADAARGV